MIGWCWMAHSRVLSVSAEKVQRRSHAARLWRGPGRGRSVGSACFLVSDNRIIIHSISCQQRWRRQQLRLAPLAQSRLVVTRDCYLRSLSPSFSPTQPALRALTYGWKRKGLEADGWDSGCEMRTSIMDCKMLWQSLNQPESKKRARKGKRAEIANKITTDMYRV